MYNLFEVRKYYFFVVIFPSPFIIQEKGKNRKGTELQVQVNHLCFSHIVIDIYPSIILITSSLLPPQPICLLCISITFLFYLSFMNFCLLKHRHTMGLQEKGRCLNNTNSRNLGEDVALRSSGVTQKIH